MELRPLLVEFVSPARPPADPTVGAPEQPPEEKVRSWLAGQAAADSRSKTERKEETARSRAGAGRGGKQAELNMRLAVWWWWWLGRVDSIVVNGRTISE